MKKYIFLLPLLFSLALLNSCTPSPTAHIQGVYELDKKAFKAELAENIEDENSFILDLMNIAINQAKIELQVKGDSMLGVIHMIEDISVMESKIIMRNDTLMIITEDNEAYLLETETGLSFRSPGSEIALELIKTDKEELSVDTREMMKDKKNIDDK